MSSQRNGKYSCLETESRYLLSKVPDGISNNSLGWLITDQYLPSTRLRLRHMRSIHSDEQFFKLTQKYRSETQNAYETTITNIYLNEAEFSLFSRLEGKILKKKRYTYPLPGRSASIDVFEDRHQGLVLAEVELEEIGGSEELALPSIFLNNVTEDPFFTGGCLAMMTEEEFSQGLALRLSPNKNKS